MFIYNRYSGRLCDDIWISIAVDCCDVCKSNNLNGEVFHQDIVFQCFIQT